ISPCAFRVMEANGVEYTRVAKLFRSCRKGICGDEVHQIVTVRTFDSDPRFLSFAAVQNKSFESRCSCDVGNGCEPLNIEVDVAAVGAGCAVLCRRRHIVWIEVQGAYIYARPIRRLSIRWVLKP